LARFLKISFLHCCAPDIHPAIGILRIDLRDSFEGCRRTAEIALQKQTYSIVVPALPVFSFQDAGLSRLCAAGGNSQCDLVFSKGHDGYIGNDLYVSGNVLRRPVE
jgi:hypothetical protein